MIIISNFHKRRIFKILPQRLQAAAEVHALQLVPLEHFVIIDGKLFKAREEHISRFS